jgi:hypothetical protein
MRNTKLGASIKRANLQIFIQIVVLKYMNVNSVNYYRFSLSSLPFRLYFLTRLCKSNLVDVILQLP